MKKLLLCAVFLLAGCSGKKGVMKAEPTPEPVAAVAVPMVVEPSPVPTHVYSKFYRVKKGDCLWTIAGKKQVYGNAFEWPLLWRANRDQIADPDLIEPAQVLSYPRMVDDFEEATAILMSRQMPPYHKHKK